MTAAQAAAFRLYANTPRERITTHACMLSDEVKLGGFRPRAQTAARREYIRKNMGEMSSKAMAEALGISQVAVQTHMRKIRCGSLKTGRPRKGN